MEDPLVNEMLRKSEVLALITKCLHVYYRYIVNHNKIQIKPGYGPLFCQSLLKSCPIYAFFNKFWEMEDQNWVSSFWLTLYSI